MTHSRRDFLFALGGLGAGAAAAGVGTHLSGRRDTASAATDAVRTIRLETREMRLHAVDAWVRDAAVLIDAERLRTILRAAARAGGATVLGEKFCVFPNGAVTGRVLFCGRRRLQCSEYRQRPVA